MLRHKFQIVGGTPGEKVYFPPTRAFENRRVQLSLAFRASARTSVTLELQASRDGIYWLLVRSWQAFLGCASFSALSWEWPLLRVVLSSHGELPVVGEISLTVLPPVVVGSEQRSDS